MIIDHIWFNLLVFSIKLSQPYAYSHSVLLIQQRLSLLLGSTDHMHGKSSSSSFFFASAQRHQAAAFGNNLANQTHKQQSIHHSVIVFCSCFALSIPSNIYHTFLYGQAGPAISLYLSVVYFRNVIVEAFSLPCILGPGMTSDIDKPQKFINRRSNKIHSNLWIQN